MSEYDPPSPVTSYPPTSPTTTRSAHSRSSTITSSHGIEQLSPLVRNATLHSPHGHPEDDDQTGLEESQGLGEDKVSSFVVILVGVAAISGLLFGYDTAAISGALVNIREDLHHALSDGEKELITASTTFGALLGGLASGALSDYTGRKLVIGIANALFLVGALLQAVCSTVPIMVLGRFIVGIGVGQASCIVPLYIGELSPSSLRGTLVTVNCSAITLGQVIAYVVGMVYQYQDGGWRWMLGLGAVPAIIQLLSLAILPESPRILILQCRKVEATAVLARIYPYSSPEEVETRVHAMSMAIRHDEARTNTSSWTSRLRQLVLDGPSRRALMIGMGLQAGQQLCGFNSLMYYSASIFASLGFHNAVGVGCIIAIVNFAFTLLALTLVDSLGRRKTMLYTVPVMVVALLLSAIFFNQLTTSTGGILEDGHDYPTALSSLIVLSMMLYVAGYASGLGNIPWQQGELFPLDVRGVGTSICTATNWSCNLLIAATFLSLMRIASPAGAFLIYALFCIAAWVFCYYLYPETSGLSLEEVYALFRDDFGVTLSISRRQGKSPPDGQIALGDA